MSSVVWVARGDHAGYVGQVIRQGPKASRVYLETGRTVWIPGPFLVKKKSLVPKAARERVERDLARRAEQHRADIARDRAMSKRKRKARGGSIWTVSGGLPGLGKRS